MENEICTFNSNLVDFSLCYNECAVEPYLKDPHNQIVRRAQECHYYVSDMDGVGALSTCPHPVGLGSQWTIPNQHTNMLIQKLWTADS